MSNVPTVTWIHSSNRVCIQTETDSTHSHHPHTQMRVRLRMSLSETRSGTPSYNVKNRVPDSKDQQQIALYSEFERLPKLRMNRVAVNHKQHITLLSTKINQEIFFKRLRNLTTDSGENDIQRLVKSGMMKWARHERDEKL